MGWNLCAIIASESVNLKELQSSGKIPHILSFVNRPPHVNI